MFRWKTRVDVIIYKCSNDNCPHRLNAVKKLNESEHAVRRIKSSQFKLCYTYREYLFKPNELTHSRPIRPKIDITKIHNSGNILGLILFFYVSFAVSARKTAFILRWVFNINVSYQTVLNYAEAASFYCHTFNMQFKGPIDNISAGDETYIRISGQDAFVFLFLSSKNHKITAYHLAHSRKTLPAAIAVSEAIRTAEPKQKLTLITDANPSYAAGIMFLNSKRLEELPPIEHRQVVGLQNLDEESTIYRPFKQLIERLNRTFKFHVRPSHGFKSDSGAMALVALFVTHYNFLRPHMALDYRTPVEMPSLNTISTIQGKWSKILSLAS
ncbi:MAG: DDE-type integrase/transposase/recombinase [Pseudomonadota bacterium]